MNNFSLAQEATATAMDSQGSSMREQAKYADSLEARINRLDTAWNKFTLSAGNAVVTDGLISAVETLNDLATVSAKAIDTFGLLSGVFGTLGVATVLLSTKFRTFTTALIFGTSTMSRTALVTSGLSGVMTRLGVATAGATAALRGLASATIVGAAFVAVGFAIEKLIGLYADAKQKQEEFEASQQKNIDALTSNKAQTEELITAYKRLSNERDNGSWDNEKETEYLQIQQQLGDTFPSLISHIDATGQAHIKSAELIDKEIQATKELLDLKREEIKLKALESFEDNIDQRDGFFGLEADIKNKREQIKELEKVAKPTIVNQAKQELLQLENEFATTALKITDEVLKVSEAYNKLEIDPTIQQSVQGFISSLDFTKLNASELEGFSIKLSGLVDKLQDAYSSGDSSGFDNAKRGIQGLVSEMGVLNTNGTTMNLTMDKVKEAVERAANMTYVGADGTDVLSDAMDGAANSASNLANAQEEFETAAERLVSVSENQLDSLYELIGSYKVLSQMESNSAQTSAELQSVLEQLSASYPHLVKGKEVNLAILEEEARANDILLKATEDLLKGTLTVEQTKTATTAIQAKRRIDILKQELAAQNAIVQKFNEMSKTLADNANTLEQEKLATRAYQRAKGLQVDIDLSIPDYQNTIDNLANSIDYHGRNTEAVKKTSKEYEHSAYFSDKFKQALETLNLELEKQEAIQARFPKHSREYQDALRAELGLLEQKKTLLQEQAKSLDAQIRSGRIQQTGLVTSKSSSPTVTTSSAPSSVGSYYLNNFRVTSQYGENRGSYTHKGLDLANGKQGDPVKSLQSGKVITATYSKSAGYWVVVQQDDGTVAKYMHLQNGLNVSAGQRVSAGQQLGKVGNTGQSTGAHLHLQIEQNGKTINPLDYLKSSNVSVSSSASDASRAAAENLQNIDEARSELIQLQQDIVGIENEMQELELALVQTVTAEQDRKINSYRDDLANFDLQQSRVDELSQTWRNLEKERILAFEAQRHLQQSTIDYLNFEIRNNQKLTAAQKSQLEEEILDRTQALHQIQQSIESSNKAIKQSYEKVADEVVDIYKKAIEIRRDEAIKALDDELDAFEKSHDRKMDLLDEELSAYEKIIDKQKESLDQQKDEEDWNKSLSERQKELQELQKEFNVWSKDDSVAGRQRASEISEEIAEMQDEINEMMRDRQYDLQQDALDKLLKDKQEQINKEKEMEDQAYETGKAQLDRQREELNQHYDNLLNDERAFAEMRNQILAGNINSITEQLRNFSSYVSGHMQSIGQSISENLIDKISEAQFLLSGLSGGVSSGGSTSNLASLLEQLKQNGFAKGGSVPHDGLTFVHGGERVLNKEDHKKFESMMKFIDKAKLWIQPMIKQPSMPMLPNLAANSNRTINISMPVTIENLNGNRQGANEFLDTINKGLNQLGVIRKL
ncbi:peptidoglycan DD-metalloendopeptidase family protein [Bacillus sp. T33-2]|uniref:peptidoglycan DD-metalloendopeptidase family protein n=1 Tax=Bacillus sp. T33-2 TaxID=2054168 RepID=UPI0021550A4E|nr:peptidoglycan DD-metalloendopeptidase family protein [Bacillus sp. T33-2]